MCFKIIRDFSLSTIIIFNLIIFSIITNFQNTRLSLQNNLEKMGHAVDNKPFSAKSSKESNKVYYIGSQIDDSFIRLFAVHSTETRDRHISNLI